MYTCIWLKRARTKSSSVAGLCYLHNVNVSTYMNKMLSIKQEENYDTYFSSLINKQYCKHYSQICK